MVGRTQKGTRQYSDDPLLSEHVKSFPVHRMATGAVYGLVLGGLYALVAGTIDVLLIRDLPLRVDWPVVWVSILTAGLGAAVLGAITAWPEDTLRGIVVGAAVIAAWRLANAFVQLQATALPWLLVILPSLVLSLPIAVVLRWLANQHVHHLEKRGTAWLRAQAILVTLVVGLGAFVGSWARMPASAEEVVRQVHRMLTQTLAQPAGSSLPFALKDVPGIRAHAGVAYYLDQRPSASGQSALDVRATFEDGYVITCVVDAATSFASCVEGDQFPSGLFWFDPNDQR
jgi:hypothetical protein